jgi:D-alanyl-D-alanine carboxypeptidase/D-alanyl-D-alanine-endopeptidase (penicillin-binding protein 4)
MRLYLAIVILAATLISCRTTHTLLSPRDPYIQLRKEINSILSDSLFISTRTGIKVVALNDGYVLYERDSKMLTNPASNIKLLTSAAALSVLDTSYQFETAVFVDKNPVDSTIAENIYLKGYGDPDLTTSDLDSLADAVRQMGITIIAHNIIVDDSFFDDNYWGAGWVWDDESDPDAPYINALSVNKNCINVTLLSDSSSSFVYLEPMTNFVTIMNKAIISDDSIHIPVKIKRLFLSNPNTILIEGEIPSYSQITQKLSLRRPELYTGTLFKESLRHRGIAVNSDIVNGIVPNRLHAVAHNYQHINKVVTNMNKVSDNLSAENTLKVLAKTIYGVPGSAKSGTFVVKRFLSTLGLDTTKCCIVDGSGVSRYNLFTVDQLVQFLIAMYKQSRIFPIFYNSLPVAGVDGTIADRMMRYPAVNNVHAKTGTLNGVSCLSGYVQTRDGEVLAFSMMIQNFLTSVTDYRQIQDKICTLLAEFSRKTTFKKGSAK